MPSIVQYRVPDARSGQIALFVHSFALIRVRYLPTSAARKLFCLGTPLGFSQPASTRFPVDSRGSLNRVQPGWLKPEEC